MGIDRSERSFLNARTLALPPYLQNLEQLLLTASVLCFFIPGYPMNPEIAWCPSLRGPASFNG